MGKNKKKRIAKFCERIGQVLTILVMEGKIIELSDETLLKIMGYLSNHEILRNVSQVSQRFYVLSKDQHLFRKIEMDCRNLPSSGKKPSKLAPCPTTAGPSQY